MNGQMRWDLYPGQQSEGDQVRRIRRDPVLCQAETPPHRRNTSQKVDQPNLMRKALSKGLPRPRRRHSEGEWLPRIAPAAKALAR